LEYVKQLSLKDDRPKLGSSGLDVVAKKHGDSPQFAGTERRQILAR
jgi:hypothetical protein